MCRHKNKITAYGYKSEILQRTLGYEKMSERENGFSRLGIEMRLK